MINLYYQFLTMGHTNRGWITVLKKKKIHLQFCKKLLGVRQQTQINFVYRELGRTFFKIGRIINVIKYWLTVLQLDDTKYVINVNNVMCRNLNAKSNRTSWTKSVRHLLQAIGFNHV